jgi:nitrogen fixation uncharacterized protein
MAIEDARNFVEQAAHDEQLREEGRRRWSEIVQVGHERGYHFDLEEFKQAERERVGDADPGGDPGEDPDTCFCI